jgi:hypothetical protein
MTDGTDREIGSVTDAAIDRVVREMMRVDAPAATRARVLARLEHPPRPLLTIPRFAAVAALASLIVLAFAVTREQPADPAGTSVAERAPGPAVQPASPDRTTSPPTAFDAGAVIRRPPSVRTALRGDANPPAAFKGTIAIAPLPQLDPIVVAPLQRAPVAPADIVVEPLAPIGELEIAPLFPSDGRD